MNRFTPRPGPEFQALRAGMGYPDVPLPAERDWQTLSADYEPVEYTAESVKRSVPQWEHPDLDGVWERTLALSACRNLLRDSRNGRPLNPAGATGVSGYGRLRQLGVNLTADGLATSDDQVLLIERGDTGQLAFPGGFRDTLPQGIIEDALDAAVREVYEETDLAVKIGRATLLHAGIAHLSLRNTDNAWIENAAYHIILPPGYHRLHQPKAKDDAKRAGWFALANIDLDSMSDAHAENARRLQDRMGQLL
jgi:ADP-ribose pyrophosphatase YjhB (NUDIX family)